MPLSDHVSIVIVKDTVGIARAGFGVPLILSHSASWVERTRSYSNLPGVAADFATDSPEYLAAEGLLSQTPKPKLIMIGRAANKPTQVFSIGVSAVSPNTHYQINVVGQGVTPTLVDVLTTSGDITLGTIDTTANSAVATAHGMSTGDGPFRVSAASGLPAPLTVDTDYWIINIDANTIKFATSKALAIALTAVDLTTTGTAPIILRRVQNDVINSQLVDRLNQVVGKNFTAAIVPGAGETDTMTVTGNTAGAWFSLAVNSPALLSNAQTHADPGVAADLDAILNESGAWYALITLFNSKALMVATATWIEANDKVYIADTCETSTVTVAVGSATDTATTLKLASRSRTMVAYYPDPSVMFAACWFGRVLPDEPGSETWNDKTLSGPSPVALTTTYYVNINAKNANSYQEVITGTYKTFKGKCADGEFFDTIRGLDWFTDDASKRIYETISTPEKLPMDPTGIARVEGALRASGKEAMKRTIFVPGSFDVQVPAFSDIPDSDKANRVLSGISFTAELDGAIQEVDVNGTVTN